MKLSRIIDFRKEVEPTLSQSKVIAEVRITNRNWLDSKVEYEKSVKFIELPEPVKVTKHFVETKYVPFIYAQRKATSDFNFLDTSGTGRFLCTSREHLDEILALIVANYEKVIEEMQEELIGMRKNVREPYKLLELK